MISDVEAGLLKAIAANRDDDTPRLVYADWLDENCGEGQSGWPQNRHGTSARAEFIRLQIETTHLNLSNPNRKELKAREGRLRRSHMRHWNALLGAGEGEVSKYSRGFPTNVTLTGDVNWEALQLPSFAGVRVLCLEWSNLSDGDLGRLAASPYLAGITALDLSRTRITDVGFRKLVSSPHFYNLRELGADRLPTKVQHAHPQLAQSANHTQLHTIWVDETARFVSHLRAARRTAEANNLPRPLPTLRAVRLMGTLEWLQGDRGILPDDLIPFTERVTRRGGGRTGRA